jgi:hypothetical protein
MYEEEQSVTCVLFLRERNVGHGRCVERRMMLHDLSPPPPPLTVNLPGGWGGGGEAVSLGEKGMWK